MQQLDNFVSQVQNTVAVLKGQMPLALFLVSILWLVLIVNKIIGYRLNLLGIYPRHPAGLLGILFHPFLHGSFNHLFFNSIPLFVLVTFLLTFGFANFVCATVFVVLISGLLIWLFGRKALHIGASGLVMGYWGYLLVYAYQHPSILTYILGGICIYYFGGLLLSIFPSEERVSWEGHLFGLIAGVATTFICPIIHRIN